MPFARARGLDDATVAPAAEPDAPASPGPDQDQDETASRDTGHPSNHDSSQTTSETLTSSAADESGRAVARAAARPRRGFRDWMPFLLVRAAHPRQAVLTALVLAGAAAVDGRPVREVGLVFGTVLVGQVILGWHNDLVDDAADRAHERSGKPIADGRLDAGNVWFALCCAVLLVVPLAIANGVTAGLCYLASVAVGMIGNVVLRRGLLSFLTWAIAFALYPAFLSYGGWGGGQHGAAPQPAMVALSALLGIGVHVLLALWGLVADNADGWTYLPLKLGLRLGATRLLVGASVYTAAVAIALAYVASQVGLRQ